MVTTKAQRKLFFNLRSHKVGFDSMSPDQINSLATKLNVKPEEVIEMEMRFSGHDIGLNPITDNDEDKFAPITYLTNESDEPSMMLERKDNDLLQTTGLEFALGKLDKRSRRIIESRWLVNDDGSSAATLHDLAAEFGVSAERIRQIESESLKKMKESLLGYI